MNSYHIRKMDGHYVVHRDGVGVVGGPYRTRETARRELQRALWGVTCAPADCGPEYEQDLADCAQYGDDPNA